jgi:hypothetical protein
MAVRMTSTEVIFTRPFVLHGFEKLEPAGTYLIETEEESVDEVSFSVWKRTAMVMHIMRSGAIEYVRIDPEDLRKALARDNAQAETNAATEVRLQAARRPRHSGRLVRRRT